MIVLKKGGDSMYLKRKIDEYLLEWKEKELPGLTFIEVCPGSSFLYVRKVLS